MTAMTSLRSLKLNGTDSDIHDKQDIKFTETQSTIIVWTNEKRQLLLVMMVDVDKSGPQPILICYAQV